MFSKNLLLYRKAHGYSQRSLAELLDVSHTTISKLEKGELMPSGKLLISLSEILKVKIQDLMSTYKPDFEISTPFFRKKRVSKSALDYLTNRISLDVHDYITLDTLDKRDKESFSYNKFKWDKLDDYDLSASFVRNELCLPDKSPVYDLTYHLENRGFVVLQSDYPSFFDGAITYVTGYENPFIVLNETLSSDRYRFTMTHELGHHFIDFSNVNYDQKTQEKAIDMFTAAFLLPEQDMRDIFGEHRTKISIEELGIVKTRYKTSMAAIVMRISDLDIISNDYKQDIFKYFNAKKIRRNEPFQFEKESPSKKQSLVYYLYLTDIISLSRASESLKVPLEDIRESAIHT